MAILQFLDPLKLLQAEETCQLSRKSLDIKSFSSVVTILTHTHKYMAHGILSNAGYVG